MSAYLCDKNVFLFLLAAAQSVRFSRGNLYWYWDGGRHDSIGAGDFNKAQAVAEMLYGENLRSVSHRYSSDKSSATLPGSHDATFTLRDFCRAWDCDPVQVLKTIACLNYQSCETPDWEQTEAYAFLRALKNAAIQALPGYDDAAWGAPEEGSGVSLLAVS